MLPGSNVCCGSAGSTELLFSLHVTREPGDWVSRCVLNSLYEPIQGTREAVAVLTACAFAVCAWRECLLRAGHCVIAAGDARTDSRKCAAARSTVSLGGPRGHRRGACTSLDCLSCSTPCSWFSSLSFPDTCTNSGTVLTPGMSLVPLSAASVANRSTSLRRCSNKRVRQRQRCPACRLQTAAPQESHITEPI